MRALFLHEDAARGLDAFAVDAAGSVRTAVASGPDSLSWSAAVAGTPVVAAATGADTAFTVAGMKLAP